MLKKDWRNRLPGLALAVISVIMLMITSNINWGKDHWNQIVRSDGEGYYAYLPAVFIYHDLSFGFYEHIELEKYHDPFNVRDYRETIDGNRVNKCYCGEALAIMPFWLCGHVWAKVAGYDADGYSKPYPVSLSVAALFYLLLGLFFLDRVLKLYSIKPLTRALVLLATLFGTNLFYYSISEPSVTHVYSFGLITLFFFLLKKYFTNPSGKMMVFSGLLLGLIVLVRPANMLIILTAPFAAGSWKNFIHGLKAGLKKPLWLAGSALLFFIIAGIQLIIYKIQTGHFIVYSYGQESFDFREFHFIDFLFSYKKGYFLYTPLAFLALAGFRALWKNNRFGFYNLAVFLILIIYIFSSWWSWWYGGSFSSRVMVDYLVFFMLLLALAIDGINRRWMKNIYITFIILLILVCQIQTFQYRYNRIHYSDMTKEKYWDVFLRIDRI